MLILPVESTSLREGRREGGTGNRMVTCEQVLESIVRFSLFPSRDQEILHTRKELLKENIGFSL